MPIRLPDAPDDASRAARNQLSAILSASHADSHATLRAMSESATAGSLNLSQPHRVYTATLTDVLTGSVLAAATEDSWRYLVLRNDDSAVAAVEVTSRDSAPMELSQINEGPFVAGTVDAIGHVVERLKNDPRIYELRLLRIPALYVIALWLHADHADELIPVAPAPAVLRAGEVYDETAFVAALRPLAEQRTLADDTMG